MNFVMWDSAEGSLLFIFLVFFSFLGWWTWLEEDGIQVSIQRRKIIWWSKVCRYVAQLETWILVRNATEIQTDNFSRYKPLLTLFEERYFATRIKLRWVLSQVYIYGWNFCPTNVTWISYWSLKFFTCFSSHWCLEILVQEFCISDHVTRLTLYK